MANVFDYITRGNNSQSFGVHKAPDPRNQRHELNNTLSLSADKHKELLDALMNIIYPHQRTRKHLIERYDAISKDLAAYQANTGLEKQRENMNDANMSTEIPDQRYPLAQGQLDDITTHLLQLLFPSRRMYGPKELDPELQNEAVAFAERINMHGVNFAHYKVYGKMLYDAVAYNSGGISVEWSNKFGWLAERQNEIGTKGTTSIVQAGNKIKYMDLYNTIWDYNCKPEEYPQNAHFYAEIEPASEFELKLMFERGLLFGQKMLQDKLRSVTWMNGKPELSQKNSNQFYNEYFVNLGLNQGSVHSQCNSGLFIQRPPVRSKIFFDAARNSEYTDEEFDFKDYMTCDDSIENMNEIRTPHANELLHITVRLIPNDYGLSDNDEMQIWKFSVLNGTWIVFGQQMSTAHGLLNATRCVPKTENGNLQSKSIGEKLTPFQDLISNMHNLYIKGMRKNANNGLIFYDQDAIKLNEHRDPTSGYVPVQRGIDAQNKHTPVSSLVHTVHERPEINTTLNDIAQVHDLMQDVMPTDMLRNMSNLNRATEHQSQTVSNAASRRLYKLAREIADEAIVPVLYMMSKNTIHMEQPFEINDGKGQTIMIDPSSYVDRGIELGLSDGLRGIDNVAIGQSISSIIQYTLQSAEANQQLDVVKMIEYFMHFQGAAIDIEKFRYQNPFDQMSNEQKTQAFQVYQQVIQQQQEGGNAPAQITG